MGGVYCLEKNKFVDDITFIMSLYLSNFTLLNFNCYAAIV